MISGVGSYSPVAAPIANRRLNALGSEQGVASQQAGQKQLAMTEALQRFSAMERGAKAEETDTFQHEAAHQKGAAQQAGPPSFGYRTLSMKMPDGSARSVTYAASGSVPITSPAVVAVPPTAAGRQQLQQVQTALQRVYAGATAPYRMSGADSSIAASASAKLNTVAALLSKMDTDQPSLQKPARGLQGQRLNLLA